jgi:hypothetical protein
LIAVEQAEPLAQQERDLRLAATAEEAYVFGAVKDTRQPDFPH